MATLRLSWHYTKRTLKYTSAIAAFGLTLGSAYIYHDPALSRGADFWFRVGPIVGRYFLVAKTSKWLGRSQEDRDERFKELHEKMAPRALEIILRFRGVYVKLAQVASVRPEFFPEPYRKAFAKCQDAVPYDKELTREKVRHILEADLGKAFDQLFENFDFDNIIGAASIGQAYRATAIENANLKTDVVVKVQYPHGKELFDLDFLCARKLAEWGAPKSLPFYDSACNMFRKEFNYKLEAENIEHVYESVMVKGKEANGENWSSKVVVPRPLMSHCGDRCVTMSYCPGERLETAVRSHLASLGVDVGKGSMKDWIMSSAKSSSIQAKDEEDGELKSIDELQNFDNTGLELSQSNAETGIENSHNDASAKQKMMGSPLPYWMTKILVSDYIWRLVRWSLRIRRLIFPLDAETVKAENLLGDPDRLLKTLVEVHGFEIFETDRFNGDPHPGNLLIDEHGKIGLIDYGQCGKCDSELKVTLAKLIRGLAYPEAFGDDVAPAFWEMGFETEKMDPDFAKTMAELIFVSFKPEWLNHDFHEKLHSSDSIIKFPASLLMVYRTAVLLRGLGFTLQCNVNIASNWGPYAKRFLENSLS